MPLVPDLLPFLYVVTTHQRQTLFCHVRGYSQPCMIVAVYPNDGEVLVMRVSDGKRRRFPVERIDLDQALE